MSTTTQVYTYLTQAGTTELLRRTLPTEWLEITLRLETAGPVAIGHLEALDPATSGKGRLLSATEDVIVKLSPSSSLFIFSASVDRVSVHINAIPGLEMLLQAIATGLGSATPRKVVSEQVDIGRFGFPQTPQRKK